MLSLLVFLFTTVAARHSRDASDSLDDHLASASAVGACCFGDKCIGTNYTRARCDYDWAGPNTDASDCYAHKPCCYPNGKCRREQCFRCALSGGTLVKYCDSHCTPVPTTTPLRTKTKPKTTSTDPVTHHTHHTHHTEPTGCCCSPGATPTLLTVDECHRLSHLAVYKGDGTRCTHSTCQPQCCTALHTCEQCNSPLMSGETFLGFGAGVCTLRVNGTEPCGVACCVNARVVSALSSLQCTSEGGQPLRVPYVGLTCGGGCCNVRDFRLVANASQCSRSGDRYMGDGVGYSPGICGGCCCLGNGGGELTTNRTVCEASGAGAVFQGNGVHCLPDAKRSLPREEASSSSSESANVRRAHRRSRSSGSSSSWSTSDSDSEQNQYLSELDSDLERSSSSLSSSHSASAFSVNGDEYTEVAFDPCSDDGCCCLSVNNNGAKVMMPDILACNNASGVWKGVGSRCATTKCGPGGVCCLPGGGAKLVHKYHECNITGGHYLGDGSTIDMRGVCDQLSGACLCGLDPTIEDCLETPNATLCYAIGGSRFLGSWSRCEDLPCPALTSADSGACCVPPEFEEDARLCRPVASKTRCALLHGSWQGKGSVCGDDTCSTKILGRCCVPSSRFANATFQCIDGLAAYECRDRHGKWGGALSHCSDEFACDMSKRGACCREAYPCEQMTQVACRIANGRFQSVGSTCQDLNSGVCEVCAPCHIESPECSSTKPCENKYAFCSREYGRCIALAVPANSSAVSPNETYVGPLLCSVLRETEGATSSDTPQGLPCTASPLFGKGRLGTCEREGNDTWVCRHIREFHRGCKCTGGTGSRAVQTHVHTDCGTIHGLVQLELNGTLTPAFGQRIELYRRAHADDNDRGEKVQFDFVAHQSSGSAGHYAFVSLKPGVYDVRIQLEHCWAPAKHAHTERIVSVECRDDSQRQKYRLDSIVLEHHDRNEAHLSSSVDFHLVRTCVSTTMTPIATSSSANRSETPSTLDATDDDDDDDDDEFDDNEQFSFDSDREPRAKWVPKKKVPAKRKLEQDDVDDDHHRPRRNGATNSGGDGTALTVTVLGIVLVFVVVTVVRRVAYGPE